LAAKAPIGNDHLTDQIFDCETRLVQERDLHKQLSDQMDAALADCEAELVRERDLHKQLCNDHNALIKECERLQNIVSDAENFEADLQSRIVFMVVENQRALHPTEFKKKHEADNYIASFRKGIDMKVIRLIKE
jgi:hypothetical protein